MLRKFIAAGIGTVATAATIAASAFTAPAQAALVIPGVCLAAPGLVATATGANTSALLLVGSAQSTLNNKNTALNQAVTDYVTAAIAYVQALDSATGVPLALSNLNGRIADLGTKAADWTAANAALFAAKNGAEATAINLNALTQLTSGLCV